MLMDNGWTVDKRHIQHNTASSVDSSMTQISITVIVVVAVMVVVTDIYTVDTVLPIHIAWHGEATTKSTTKYGRRQFTLKRATLLLRSKAER